MPHNKTSYFQGGGGVNEPTPGKPKYKAEPALLIQPRFEDPLYRNYDVYHAEGNNGEPQYGPGAGHNHINDYKSIKDFLQHQRQRLKGKYVADDMWITEDNRKERADKMKTRAELLSSIVKAADHMMPPKEHGTSIYDWKNSPYQGKPKAPKRDSNHLDFQYDAIDAKPNNSPIVSDSENYDTPIMLGPAGSPNDLSISPGQVNLGDFESYPYGAQIGGLLDKYLGKYDPDDKPESDLDWGNDLTESTDPPGSHSFESVHEDEDSEDKGSLAKLEELETKYLNPAPTHGLFGLPDGVDLPDEDLGDPTTIQPYYGTYGPDSKMYEDKWNI